MEKNKTRGFITLLIMLAVLAGFGFLGYRSLKEVKSKQLGLDLSGGVSITYEATTANPSKQDMDDTVYKLQQRVQKFSTEAQVYREGTNRIKIDIPGVSNADDILEDLGKPGSLTFVGPDNQVILTGDMVKSATGAIDQSNGQKQYIVELSFNDEGTKLFGDATTKFVGQRISIVYDNKVYSNPVVQEAITGGQCRIDGMQSYEEADQLASTIRIGSLKVELQKIQSSTVGAQLGQNAISTSVKAAVIGFIAVAVFMIVIYWLPGVAAMLALALYVMLVTCLIRAFNITLTLPGIAGIILSVGMAVDANVIIFTRIREEIGNGKTVRSAVKTGFHKALSAIIDGNVTTLIAAFVLFLMGTGTIKGFAETLALGVVVSMFTAITITRTWLNAFCDLGLDNEKLFGVIRERKTIDFMGKRKVFFSIAAAVILSGFIGMAVWGAKTGSPLNLGLDFKGGDSITIQFDHEMTLDEIDQKVKPIFTNVTHDNDIQASQVKATGEEDKNKVTIKTRTLTVEESKAINEALAASEYKVDPKNVESESISGVISSEMRRAAVGAVIIALILMLIYIALRFADIRFATSAILCLVHDTLVLFSCYVLFRWSVGSSFIACMLTLVGYSINDTIVIFDRIRENMHIDRSLSREELVNKSVTETFTRSLFTSLTTFMTIFVLFIVGVSSIRDFTLPLMVGTLCGTYSSIAIASPLWCLFEHRADEKRAAVKAAEQAKKDSERAAKKDLKAKGGKKSAKKA